MTIDWWTLGLQTVNVVVLVWLLGRFFWRPMASMIEQRRAATQQLLGDAEAKRDSAAATLAEVEKTRGGFVQEHDAILAAAHDAAEQARTARLQETTKEVAGLEAAAKVAIERDKEAADKTWAERASRLAVEIAGRLAARLEGPSIRATFLDSLLQAIRTLPDPVRRTMAGNDIVLEAVSATPLEPADQERYRKLIGEAFGGRARIAFNADPALIEGLELHGPDFALTNSWRADLAQILLDLTHADKR